MIVIYGLKNCDSCRRALAIVAAAGARHRFHDLRADGLPAATLARWLDRAGWEALLNRRSTTWRELPAAEKEGLDAPAAARLLARHPTLVKRPVVEREDDAGAPLIVGLAPPQRAALEALAGA
jgi:arsenate reductase (glutaredoxin)